MTCTAKFRKRKLLEQQFKLKIIIELSLALNWYTLVKFLSKALNSSENKIKMKLNLNLRLLNILRKWKFEFYHFNTLYHLYDLNLDFVSFAFFRIYLQHTFVNSKSHCCRNLSLEFNRLSISIEIIWWNIFIYFFMVFIMIRWNVRNSSIFVANICFDLFGLKADTATQHWTRLFMI